MVEKRHEIRIGAVLVGDDFRSGHELLFHYIHKVGRVLRVDDVGQGADGPLTGVAPLAKYQDASGGFLGRSGLCFTILFAVGPSGGRIEIRPIDFDLPGPRREFGSCRIQGLPQTVVEDVGRLVLDIHVPHELQGGHTLDCIGQGDDPD